jgi:peptidoglycan-associated lipoprotein
MRILFTLGILVGALALWGCPKRPEVVQAAPAAIGPGAAAAPAPAPRVAEAPVTRPVPPPEPAVQPTPSPAAPAPAPTPAVPAAAPLKDVFFDFDKATIREDQKAALNTNVGWLKANGQRKLTIEGHCDERGTAEYNLGLGERRAKAVKDYLLAAGIPADRIATVSYGKERPFVMGHDESAWKWNRRAHFAITSR